ncbi:FadR/GntR family transcriptional regulator [Pseudonocardia acaciae]|uniref:FadR/GntR family transcriptional regulator n=1 Tax=Pseudonocardia acaciae TaxID=551276 RepID=UPI00048EAF9D|nr:FCD domain-containing protein [Pseudonocardia acaciae]
MPGSVETETADLVGTGKLAARVARQIERDIVRSGWQVGTMLGSETELRERYQVSRAVLREAIRLVEHHQVAAMRRGPAGGLVVREPDAGAATSAVVVYLEFVGTTLEHLLAARLMIEPLAVALAAEQITEAGIGRLRAVLDAEAAASPRRDAHAREQLHLVLAELSGNPALQLFVDVLLRLTWRYSRGSMAYLPDPSHPALAEAHEAHQAIVNAVVAGEGARAEFRALQHLEAVAEFLRYWRPSTAETASSIWATPTPSHTQDQKLAEVVAQRILGEITGGGWEVGSVIGSEAALLDKFEVSRAVLREAVRLLEYHSVARMRRGPGGGLVVAEPDPSASIEAMALYLGFQGIEIEHLRVIREAVELACVDRVATRASQPEVARRLRAMLHGGPNGAAFGAGGGIGARMEASHQLHIELAELSGNPVLALFVRILIRLWARQHEIVGEETAPRPAPAADGNIVAAHQGIVEALLAGDGGLARHRMRRHLELLTEWWQ